MTEEMVDAIKEGQIITIAASQARSEDLFVLRRHGAHVHVEQAQQAPAVSFSARRKERESDSTLYRTVQRWHSYEPEYKKNNVVKDLIENFHWEIARGRKVKNLSRAQLARAINVPEHTVKMIENGELPSDDYVLVSKIEHLLGIRLRRSAPATASPGAQSMQGPATTVPVSLASLQRLREEKTKDKKPSAPARSSSVVGSDIEIIE